VDGVIDAVERGVLDIGLSNPTFEPGKAALLNMSFYAPFGSPDPKVMQRVAMRILREAPGIQESLKPFGVRVLQMSALENYGLMSATKVARIDDMKGMKIGVSAANSSLYLAAGATTIVMPAPEAYMSIKSGLIQGQVFYESGLDAFKLSEVTKYFLKTGQGSYVGSAMFINSAVYDRLPKDLAAIIDQVAAETSAKTADLNVERERKGEEAARKAGVTISELSLAERVSWLGRVKDLPMKQAKALDAKGLKGTETFMTYFRLLKQEGYSFPAGYTGF
jgi:TRAP-type C4-dicarboxylate transport system substrate-binding protein